MNKPAGTSKSKLMKLNPYPEYKDSGVMWLGKVPTHWAVIPNRGAFIEVNDQNHPHEEMLSVTISRGVIKQSTLLDDSSTKDGSRIDRSSYKLVKPGDIAYNKMRAWQGAIGVSTYRGIISPAYVVERPREGNGPDFLHYLLRTPAFAREAERNSYGIASDMWSLRPEHFKTIRSCLPPPEEQACIVRFLEHADEQIHRYIASKERLIALMEEERQAIIQQAVTRGLDPNVRLKDAGVEWLGDMPEHWEVTRTRFLFKEVDRRSSTGNETHLSMSQVLGLVPSHQVEQTLISDSYVGGKLCEKGDLVLNRLKAHLGVFALADQKGVISPDYSVFRKRLALEMEYFTQVLRLPALRPELRIRSKGIVEGFWRLYTGDLFDIRLPVPPVAEQVTIVDNLSRMTGKLNATIARTRRQIDLMNEYRTRLTADVVTGQLDVQEA